MEALSNKEFYTPERAAREGPPKLESPRGELLIVSCRSGEYLAARVAARYQGLLAEARSRHQVARLAGVDFQFSDTETCVRLERHVAGCDVFLFQALVDPASGRSTDENYLAFLLAAETLRQWGAHHVTAILPYLAYTRQDKPTRNQREPTTARFMADLTLSARIDRLVTWHPHCTQLQGYYAGIRVDMLDSLQLFTGAFGRFRGQDDAIVVAPDVGASKFATYLAQALELTSAIAMKVRPRPEEAVTTDIIGDFSGKRTAIVVDDMISTGGTVYALIKRLVEEKGVQAVHLGASHNLCVPQAHDRLLELHANYHLRELVVTNSIPQTTAFQALPFFSVKCLSDPLARVINRIYHKRSVSELFQTARPDSTQ